MTRGVAYAMATWFGCGYAPKGPGTVGSLAAAAMCLAGLPPGPAALILLLPAVWASGVVAREKGEDPQIVVVDEVIGQWIALVPAAQSWKAALVAVVLFRLFDIWKPGPIGRLEHLPGGWGVMMDDVAAGVLAGFLLLSARWFNLIS